MGATLSKVLELLGMLKSGVSRELKGHFLLNEDAIRRILGVLEAKAKELNHLTSIVFHVKREDDRFYETTNLEDVLSDANTPGHRINEISIELRNTDPAHPPKPWERNWIAAILFKRNGGKQAISIEAEDRNWALLLADELEPQVVRTFTPKQINSWLLVGFYIAMGALFLNLLKYVPKFAVYDIVPLLRMIIWLGGIFLTFSTIDGRTKLIAKWAGPESSFHWGEQEASYNHQQRIRENLFWVVLVGFVVGTGVSLFSNTFLPQSLAVDNNIEQHNNANESSSAPNQVKP
jgi:hypothetical protein